MKNGTADLIMRHVRKLAQGRDAAALSDRELLHQFVERHDEAAYEALVRRHSPMVLSVARRVLHNWHDAEDVCQATFLLLAREAGRRPWQESVANWLYTAAYHMALTARRGAVRRARREARAAVKAAANPLAEISGQELFAVLDEELFRLPERLRAPLVLCYLQGATRDEAARQLGCPLGTFKNHLEQGRRRLHAALRQRGLGLAAALLPIPLSQGAGAAPAALAAKATARAALAVAAGQPLSGTVSPQVSHLLRRGLGPMIPTKLKVGLVALTLVCCALTAGAVLTGAAHSGKGAGSPPTGKTQAAAAEARAKAGDRRRAAGPAPAADNQGEQVPLSGRVLDAGGKPVARAEVALLGLPMPTLVGGEWLEEKVLARARTGADGRYRLALSADSRAGYQAFYALAGKAGHGLVLERLRPVPTAAAAVLRLPPEKVIRGRLLNLQGLPAAGVRVRVEWLGRPPVNGVGRIGLGALPRDRFPLWPRATTSGKDGTFVINGLGPELRGYLRLESDHFAPESVAIQPGTASRVQQVTLTLAPGRLLEGRVTAEDTGKPVPHAEVELWSGERVRADAQGRYLLRPRSERSYTVQATAPAGLPYLRREKLFEWPKGAIRHRVNLALKRGVLVRGKVTEAISGKPVAGAHVHDAAHRWTGFVKTGPDGTFQIAVAPGRGHLLIKGPGNAYIPVQVTEGELRGGKPSGTRNYPDAIIPLDVKAGGKVYTYAAKLRRGVSIRGRVLGPDGKPVAEGTLMCWSQLRPGVCDWWNATLLFSDGRFELHGCDQGATYPVYFLDARNRLGASVRVSAKAAGGKPLTVRLAPCGRAVVRFVDNKGKPLARASAPPLVFVARPGEKTIRADTAAVESQVADAEGRCTFSALIPGATYRLAGAGGRLANGFTVTAGQTRKLPDLVIDGPP
jgi:RNA polymerase sigma factor (sigma-70 family)